MAHEKERELLEKFARFRRTERGLANTITLNDSQNIDRFLSTPPEEKEERLPVVTDEEIHVEAKRKRDMRIKRSGVYLTFNAGDILAEEKGFIEGAKWMRDRLQPVGKTDQLKEPDEEKTKGE